ncbi:MAG TPA: nucleoside-diphosphate sugar epimerase/dehydratase [Solirubrobacteraceae bacterium]|jgi:FlaA1/EpsC-like NDP-sugar epimerase
MRRTFRSAAFPLHRHSLPQLVVDAGLVALAYYLAFWLRFEGGSMPARYHALLVDTIPWVVLGTVLILALSRVYQRRWRYFAQRDVAHLLRAAVIAGVLLVAIIAVVHPVHYIYYPAYRTAHGLTHGPQTSVAVELPATVAVLFPVLALSLLVLARLAARAINDRKFPLLRSRPDGRNVLIVGAGEGGRLVCEELVRNADLGLNPIGFVDDDPLKQRLRFAGVRVRGTTLDLPQILDDASPDEVIIAIPSAPGQLRMRVVTACRDRGIPVRTLPTVFELLAASVNVARAVREVRVEDVLGREPVNMLLERVGRYLHGAVVAVTGAGGSVGSELCRQIARSSPARLILIDHAEDNIFAIMRELEEDRHVPRSLLVPVLADCKEEERMREVLSEHLPAIVFHAAAYKHVALMESNPVEAIRNNAIGTRVVAKVAGELGLGAFVLVSTDKAVMPATVMGASKALAECAIDAAQRRFPATRYMAVRFGNVLGSSGSVVPIFRRQIAAGGPVTVTHPEMTRYFMTIPEAVALVIRAGEMGEGGEMFVLDMGEPVSIMELARNMIELSGLEPGRDIPIEVIGPRPGEKLHEELFNPFEHPTPTASEKIWLARRDAMDIERVEAIFDEILLLVLEGDATGLAEKVAQLTELRVEAPVVAESS